METDDLDAHSQPRQHRGSDAGPRVRRGDACSRVGARCRRFRRESEEAHLDPARPGRAGRAMRLERGSGTALHRVVGVRVATRNVTSR